MSDSHRGSLDAKSCFRCVLSLARWTGVGKLLRAVSRSEALVLGDLLARRRIFQLDHCALASGYGADTRFISGPF